MTRPYVATRRDKFAVRLANLALLIATPHYRRLLEGAINLGIAAAVTHSHERR